MSRINSIVLRVLGKDLYLAMIPYYHRLQGEKMYPVKVQDKGVKSVFIGDKIDGGFAIVDSVIGIPPLVLSFGLGENLSFSEMMRDRYNATILGFDPSNTARVYYKNHKLCLDNSFSFFSMGLSGEDKETLFYPPKYTKGSDHSCSELLHYKSTEKDAYSVKLFSFDTILKKVGLNRQTRIDIVKMDIEGSEFEAIQSIFRGPVNILQFCLEVHPRFFGIQGKEKIDELVMIMNRNDYKVVYVSKDYTNITFLRSDMIRT